MYHSWVRSHIGTGIPGHEAAGIAAKESSDLPPFTRRVASMDLRSYMKHVIRDNWQMDWYVTVDKQITCIKDIILPWD